MSTELFDYIQVVKPSLGDAKSAKLGLLIIHYITLARVSDGCVRMENVLTTSGDLFVRKVLRNMSLVRGLAFALKVDMSCAYDDSPVPEGLRRLCTKYHIDVEPCISRNKKMENARGEMWDLVTFVRVALAVMAALHEDTLCSLDESYTGHRPAGYQPDSKWLGLGANHPVPPRRARDLPRAKTPRAVGVKAIAVPASAYGPTVMTRKISDEPATSTSYSSRSKSSARKRLPLPSSSARRSTRVPHSIPSSAPKSAPSQAAQYAQRAAMVAYHHNMQRGTTGQRMY
ncbi:hypothetical protein B0J17DRAFT_720129 [Rhizoctonia solani]|nr:hypothetical protein B0J17DRAFT_720129 [Rhizoctonia solani]